MRPFLLLFLIPVFAFSLEVDEKLTIRILKLSDSKKTILVNRGVEDGLVVGDQAKFFNESGVLGRGVVEKVSPTRSVWSIYSIVNMDEMAPDKVLNIKITDPLKLTGDESKDLTEKDLSVETPVETPKMEPSIPSAAPAPSGKTSKEAIIRNLDTKEDAKGQGRSLSDRSTYELVGSFNYTSFDYSVDLGTNGTSDNSISQLSFSLSLEKYFQTSQNLWRNFSFLLSMDYQSYSYDDAKMREGSVPEDLFGVGLGINYHLFKDPFVSSGLIPFVGAGLGFGSRQFNIIDGSTGASYLEQASLFYWNLGIGVKFFTESGWGFRVTLDYFSRSMTGETAIMGVMPDITSTGPRFWLGMSYRF